MAISTRPALPRSLSPVVVVVDAGMGRDVVDEVRAGEGEGGEEVVEGERVGGEVGVDVEVEEVEEVEV